MRNVLLPHPKGEEKPRYRKGKEHVNPYSSKPLVRTGWVPLWEGWLRESQQSAACFPSHTVLSCKENFCLGILRKGSDRNWAKSQHFWKTGWFAVIWTHDTRYCAWRVQLLLCIFHGLYQNTACIFACGKANNPTLYPSKIQYYEKHFRALLFVCYSLWRKEWSVSGASCGTG